MMCSDGDAARLLEEAWHWKAHSHAAVCRLSPLPQMKRISSGLPLRTAPSVNLTPACRESEQAWPGKDHLMQLSTCASYVFGLMSAVHEPRYA